MPEQKQNKIGQFSQVLHLLAFNARSFCMFEIAYKSLGVLVLLPVCRFIMDLSINMNGLSYIGQDNLSYYLISPITWCAAALCIFLASTYFLTDIVATITMVHMSKLGQKASVLAVTKAAHKKVISAVKPKNIPFILIVMLIMPLTSSVVASSVIGQVEIPEFIMEFIEASAYLNILYVAVIIALAVFMVLSMYVFHFFVLEDCDFVEACKRSMHLRIEYRVRDWLFCLVRYLVTSLAVITVYALITLVTIGVGVVLTDLGISNQTLVVALSSVFVVSLIMVSVFMFSLITPLCYTFVSVRYYAHKEANAQGGEEPAFNHIDLSKLAVRSPKKIRNATIGVFASVYVLAVITGGVYFNSIGEDDQNQNLSGVVAHRCGALYAPENTVSALNNASSMGANWCELDAQKCADGEIVVLHDSDFYRTTGIKLPVWTANRQQIELLDAGYLFDEKFTGEKVPTLRDMIVAAKKCGMKVQIEIKPTGFDTGIEQDVVDIVRELDFQDDCIIASLNLDVIKNVRAADPLIKTCYLMSIAYGDIASIKEADCYSVEATWVTSEIVRNVHGKAGAFICAWTVNSEESMEKALLNGADQLVTDNITLANQVIAQQKQERAMLLKVLGYFGIKG